MEQNTHIRIDNLNPIKINKSLNIIKQNEKLIIKNQLQNLEKPNIKYKNEKEINKLHLDYLNKNTLNKNYSYQPKKQGYIDYSKLFSKVYIPKKEYDYTEIKKNKPIKINIKDAINNIFINDAKKGQNKLYNKNKEKIKYKILKLNLDLSNELFDNSNNNYNKQIKYRSHLKTDRIIYDNMTPKKHKNDYYLPNIINKRNNTNENHISIVTFKNPLLHILNRNNSQIKRKLQYIEKGYK